MLALYEKAEAGEFNFFDNDIHNVKFLVLPTSAFHPSQPHFDQLEEAQVKDIIEAIIMDSVIPMDTVVSLIGILASLMLVSGHTKGENLSYRHVLPANIIHMAENS